jgi:hypothetical protein
MRGFYSLDHNNPRSVFADSVGSKRIMEFNALESINREQWLQRAVDEAVLIQKKSWHRKLGEVLEKCIYGQAPEQWLIEHHGFTNNPAPYQDVLAPNGRSVEVKTTATPAWANYVIERQEDYANESWRDMAEYVMIFVGSKKLLTYSLEGVYKWEDKRLVKISENSLSTENLISLLS